MKKAQQRYIGTIVVLTLLIFIITKARSPFRTPDPLLPRIEVQWEGDNSYCFIADSHLEEYPYFKIFNKSFFDAHQLPSGRITFRNNPELFVEGETLTNLIDTAIDEINLQKKQFTHFVIVHDKNFNRKQGVGLLVLRFKKYPLIVKLFIETPSSFVEPFNKGFEPIWFFFMGGGTSRHLNGFTRIPNLENVQAIIKNNKRWSSYVDFPRKWFWMPKKAQWMSIKGYNIGSQKEHNTKIPACYCIITDEIKAQRHFSLYNPMDRATALSFCNDLQHLIDAHLDNFIIEEETNKLVVIDTEHFPSVVGLSNMHPLRSYADYYVTLMKKAIKDIYCRTKQARRAAQFSTYRPFP